MSRSLRMPSLAVGLSLLVAAVVALGSPPAAQARVVDRYCSPSGDYCTAIAKRDGEVRFKLRTLSFAGWYRIAVTGPNGERTGRKFKLVRDRVNDLWRDSVNWANHFPNEGSGRYKVVWRYQGTRLGPALHFRR